MLVCVILIIGKGLFHMIKNYIEEKREASKEAYDPAFADGADARTMTLEQIQEANRRRRVTMVDVDAPAGPVDLSFYGEPQQKEAPKKKPGFFDRIHKKEPELPQTPVYTTVYNDDGSRVTYMDQAAAETISGKTQGTGSPMTVQSGAARAQQPYAPNTIGANSRVSDSGHPFYQIELDNKFREKNSSGGSIIKTGYEDPSLSGPAVTEKEAARRAAVESRLQGTSISQVPIHGLTETPQTETPSASYNPYDAIEPDEAVAPTREEMQSGGLRLVKGGSTHDDARSTTSADTRTLSSADGQRAAHGGTQNASESASDAVIAPVIAPVKEYRFPPIDLLHRPSSKGTGMTGDQLKSTAAKLQNTLQSFGVNVTVTNISCGPSVTRYELTPEQGVKVSRITSLENDIKLNLAAEDIRIEAPIPGKAAVGIEVPNTEASGVMLRTLVESQEFKTNKGKITFAVGKDIGGNIVLSDIAKMPHLLIAGATGSGKSVCINTMIISLLYKYKPEDLRLIMIDPKVVELSVYNGIPHLLIPVVTDPRKASNALNWAVAEMTHRYELFANQGVRNLEGFNEKIEASTEPLTDDKGNVLRKMPQIVIIVDELADLMMVAPGEVEDAICRLAQLARAAGIHLIIATQRPSVDVITGLIKANIPSRIAFAVSSGIDSRTILDQVGAEKLLGKGDMLFFPQGIPKPVRLQGPFVSDEEIAEIVAYLCKHNSVNYDSKASEDIQNNEVATVSEQMKGGDTVPNDGRDEFFAQAGRFIIEKDKASIGMLQRVYKIGFNRAARIMDQLSEAGVVGPEEGTKPRKILMTAVEFEAFLAEQQK
ncbi:MAG: DNA translocase FtsK [Lachnospiraceae bacterium]|nr:DNA translocase FtsK [Lachnospiraceae bacterium]